VGPWAGAFIGLVLWWFMGWCIDGLVGGGLVPLKGLDMFSDFLHCPIYKFLHFRFFSIKRGFLKLQVLPVPRMDWERLTDGLLDWWIIAFIHTFYHDCNEFPIHAWIEVIHFKTKRVSRVRL
jgi:hypothetical protein